MNYCAPGGFLCRCIDKEGKCVSNSSSGNGSGSGDNSDDEGEEKDKLLSRLIANK